MAAPSLTQSRGGSLRAPSRPLAHPTAYEEGGDRGTDRRAATRLRLRLEPDLDAAGRAREALHELADELEERLVQDMDLLVTELVTNSVRHADAAPGEPVLVEIAVDGDRVHVAVEDGGSGFSPMPRTDRSPDEGGWGLHLVDRVSSRWGVHRDGRTRVWLELGRDPGAAGRDRPSVAAGLVDPG